MASQASARLRRLSTCRREKANAGCWPPIGGLRSRPAASADIGRQHVMIRAPFISATRRGHARMASMAYKPVVIISVRASTRGRFAGGRAWNIYPSVFIKIFTMRQSMMSTALAWPAMNHAQARIDNHISHVILASNRSNEREPPRRSRSRSVARRRRKSAS